MVLVIGGLAATALSRVVRGATSETGVGNADLLATITTFAVWAFAIVIAINQIGVATTLVNTLFMGTIGALALAFGLAFGLGGRDAAARLVDGWYQTGQRAMPRTREPLRGTTPMTERGPAPAPERGAAPMTERGAARMTEAETRAGAADGRPRG